MVARSSTGTRLQEVENCFGCLETRWCEATAPRPVVSELCCCRRCQSSHAAIASKSAEAHQICPAVRCRSFFRFSRSVSPRTSRRRLAAPCLASPGVSRRLCPHYVLLRWAPSFKTSLVCFLTLLLLIRHVFSSAACRPHLETTKSVRYGRVETICNVPTPERARPLK
jgi:hypothetical protein